MKPFQLYLMKSIRTIMQHNLFSVRPSISLVPCPDQQVPYLKVSGITKYTLRFIYERSKLRRKLGSPSQDREVAFYVLNTIYFISYGLNRHRPKKVKKTLVFFRWHFGYHGDINPPMTTICCFLILSLSNCKTNRLRSSSVWSFLFSHYGN